MENLFIWFIHFYQKLPLRSHSCCRFYPTCSNYAIEAIQRYGCIKGSFLSFKRILRCNPFHKGGLDPLVKENEL